MEHSDWAVFAATVLLAIAYFTHINGISHRKPITPDVVKAVNALELIALAYESGIIDRALIMRVFRASFLQLALEIEKCGELPGYDPPKTGEDLLRENHSLMTLLNSLRIKEYQRDMVDNV
jgi:hypothetical protein